MTRGSEIIGQRGSVCSGLIRCCFFVLKNLSLFFSKEKYIYIYIYYICIYIYKLTLNSEIVFFFWPNKTFLNKAMCDLLKG